MGVSVDGSPVAGRVLTSSTSQLDLKRFDTVTIQRSPQ
jgi:hypothetical protein